MIGIVVGVLFLVALVSIAAITFLGDSSDETATTTTTTTTTEPEPEPEPEEEEEEEPDESDAASAAIEELERNFGLSAPSDSGLGIDGISADEEACLVEELLANPDLLAVAESLDTATVEDQAAVLDLMFACIDPSVLGTVFAQGIAESSPLVTDEQAQCLGDEFANLSPESIAEFLILNSDPTYTPSDQAVQDALTLFTNCDVDPTLLG